MKNILLILFCFTGLTGFSQEWKQHQFLVPEDGNEYDYFGRSVSISRDYAIIGAPFDTLENKKGSVYIYHNEYNNWVQTAKLRPSNTYDAKFGYTVNISGDYAVVGAPKYGAAYIFHNNNGIWEQQARLSEAGVSSDDLYGIAVCINGDYAMVGAPNQYSYYGCVYIYHRDGEDWELSQELSNYWHSYGQNFGQSISIENETAVIGAPVHNKAYVFKLDPDDQQWHKRYNITSSHAGSGDYFGYSVDISGDFIIIGSPFDSDILYRSGSAYIYQFVDPYWEEIIKIENIFPGVSDYFGLSVAVSGDFAVMGAWQHDNERGRADVYENINGVWELSTVLEDLNGYPEDAFGNCVDIQNDNILIGVPADDVFGHSSGSAVFYKRKGVYGKIFNDINENCYFDSLELGINRRKAIITPGNLIVETGRAGIWNIDSLPAGEYFITVDTSGNWLPTCPVMQSFTVVHADSLTQAPSFGFVSTEPCAEPDISVNMPFMRPCFTDQKIYIEACNTDMATGLLEDAYVELELDSLIIPLDASIPYTYLGENLYKFDIGTLYPGMCESFWVNTELSCDAILGQTLCMEASLFPADSCIFDTIPNPGGGGVSPCEEPWDKSSLSVEGWCQNDSVYFTVTNTGEPGGGDMVCWSAVRVYIDGEFFLLDSVMLAGGETEWFIYSGDGRTWRLEADQHPLHPGNSHPNATVELCGNLENWTPGLVMILAQDDADPVIDIFCGEVTGSYDPNDKSGMPGGVGIEHFILPNGKFDYTVRFQNTGTDTAFTVIIRDTLDADLNILSVEPGATSHSCNFRMYGPRVLEWTFNNILLPDSNHNEPESHGFVSFSVDQLNDLPDGTEISNNAGIYFDFNEPVITNTVSHTVNRELYNQSWTEERIIYADTCEFTYNGIHYTQSGTYYQIADGGANPDTLLTLVLTINNTYVYIEDTACLRYRAPDGSVLTESGRYMITVPAANGCDTVFTIYITIDTVDVSLLVDDIIIYANAENAKFQWVDCSDNFSWIEGETGQYFTALQTGSYAVIVTQDACTDTSECVQITVTDVNEHDSDRGFKLYPNPTSGKFTIENLNGSDDILIQVQSVTGVKLSEFRTNEEKTEIDLSTCASGVYFIIIRNEKYIITEKIFIE